MELKFDELKNVPQDQWTQETLSDNDILGNGDNSGNWNTPPPPPPIPENGIPPQAPPPGTTTLNIGQKIPAEIVIGMGDKVLAGLAVFVASSMDIKVTRKEVELTAGERDFLNEPVQSYLNTLNITLTPLDAMLLAIGSVYVGKVIAIAGKPKEPKFTKVDLNNPETLDTKPKRTYKTRVKK